MRARGILRLTAALQVFLLLASLFLPGLAAAATIQTDLFVYQNGDTVNVTGVGFGATEVVDFATTDPLGATVDSGTATSDSSGNVAYSFVLNASEVGLYTTTGTGESSGLVATTQFDPNCVGIDAAAFAWKVASFSVTITGTYVLTGGCSAPATVSVSLRTNDNINNDATGSAVAGPTNATINTVLHTWSITFASLLPADGTYDVLAQGSGTPAANYKAVRDVYLGVDTTPPTVTATIDRADNGSGWFNNVTGAPKVSYTCSDSTSGLATGAGACPNGSFTFPNGNPSVHDVTVFDKAGNSTLSHLSLLVDTALPTISGALSPAAASTGWWNIATGAPTVTYTCGDSGPDTVVSCSAPHLFGEGASQSDTGTVTDTAGNSQTATVSGVNVDLTAPTSTVNAFTTPAENAAFTLTGTASDATSKFGGATAGEHVVLRRTSGVPGVVATSDRPVANPSGVWTWNFPSGEPAGTYCLDRNAVDAAGNSEGLNSSDPCFTIVPSSIVLTVTASSPADGHYGDSVPAISPSYSGFTGGDTAASLTAQPTCSTVYTQAATSTPGNYATSCSGGVSSKYTFVYVPGNFHVLPAPLTITASSPAGPFVYGAAVPTISAGYIGFVYVQTAADLGGVQTCGTAYAQFDAPGAYATSCSGYTSTNYAITYVDGSISVGQKVLTITASSPADGYYGAAVPTISAGYSGFVSGEGPANLSGTQVCGTDYTQVDTSTPGDYATFCSGYTSSNYSISYVAGNFHVVPAPLTITASSPADGYYGAAVPTISAGYSGFVYGQGAGDLTTAPSCDTVYTQAATSTPGNYATNCSGASSSNYSISYVAGNFHVVPAPLTITADNKTMILHATLPTFTVSYSGFVYGQTYADLSGSLSCGTTATSASPVGSYPITCSGYTSTNYSITWVPGTLKIQYNFAGFLQPVNDTAHSQVCGNPCPISIFKGGSTIPFKFVLTDANGVIVQPATAPLWVTPIQQGPVSGSVSDTTPSTTPTNGISYVWDGSQWHYNWNTPKSATGFYWLVGAKLDDGTTQWVWIGLR